MNARHKRLPAFGRDFLAKRRLGIVPARGVWITNTFKRARGYPFGFGHWCVMVPDEVDPLLVDFTFCAGLDVTVSADKYERLEALLHGVAAFCPRRLVGISREPARIIPFIEP